MGSTSDFIKLAQNVHGDRYDYSLCKYRSINHKIKIICKEHGVFEQTPQNHLRGHNCFKCARREQEYHRMTMDVFLDRACAKFGKRYDYSLVMFNNVNDIISIGCKVHGIFKIRLYSHLWGKGCPQCSMSNYLLNKKIKYAKTFLEKAIDVHGGRYDYSKVDYVKRNNNVIIICNRHGEFLQSPTSHLKGAGCPLCARESIGIKNRLTLNDFIEHSRQIYGDKFDYSMVEYNGINQRVSIICPKHGVFRKKPIDYLRGHGCTCCNKSLGENIIDGILKNNKIIFETEKTFPTCKMSHVLRFDFYLSDLNILIEYHGGQHFKPVKYFGGQESFNTLTRSDSIKKEWANDHNIPLYVFSYKDKRKHIEREILKIINNAINRPYSKYSQ